MSNEEIRITLYVKDAKKLLEALSNREFKGLTKARADALSGFMEDLLYEIEMSKVDRRRAW